MLKKYLSAIQIRKFSVALAPFHCSNHILEIENGRKQGIDVTERTCKHCLSLGCTFLEDEYHFVCKCPLYHEMRQKYLPFVNNYGEHDFISVMCSTDANIMYALAKFVFYGMIIRKDNEP